MATSNYTELDFDKVYRLVESRGITLRELNTALGRNVSFMSNCKKRGLVPSVCVPLLLKILNCTLEDISKDEHVEDSIDTHIIQEIGDIKGKLEFMYEMMIEIHNETRSLRESITPDLLTDKDKAVLLLKQMMGDTARVDEHDYIAKCNEIGVDNHSRKYAIEKVNALTQTIGYGKNAKRIIYKRARD